MSHSSIDSGNSADASLVPSTSLENVPGVSYVTYPNDTINDSGNLADTSSDGETRKKSDPLVVDYYTTESLSGGRVGKVDRDGEDFLFGDPIIYPPFTDGKTSNKDKSLQDASSFGGSKYKTNDDRSLEDVSSVSGPTYRSSDKIKSLEDVPLYGPSYKSNHISEQSSPARSPTRDLDVQREYRSISRDGENFFYGDPTIYSPFTYSSFDPDGSITLKDQYDADVASLVPSTSLVNVPGVSYVTYPNDTINDYATEDDIHGEPVYEKTYTSSHYSDPDSSSRASSPSKKEQGWDSNVYFPDETSSGRSSALSPSFKYSRTYVSKYSESNLPMEKDVKKKLVASFLSGSGRKYLSTGLIPQSLSPLRPFYMPRYPMKSYYVSTFFEDVQRKFPRQIFSDPPKPPHEIVEPAILSRNDSENELLLEQKLPLKQFYKVPVTEKGYDDEKLDKLAPSKKCWALSEHLSAALRRSSDELEIVYPCQDNESGGNGDGQSVFMALGNMDPGEIVPHDGPYYDNFISYTYCPGCGISFHQSSNEPRLLRCYHSLCSQCIEDRLRKSKDSSFTCKICNFLHSNIKRPEDLHKAGFLKTMARMRVELNEKEMPPCAYKPCNENVEKWCEDCGIYLCTWCARDHEDRLNHLTGPYQTGFIEEIREKFDYDSVFCKDHGSYSASRFCSQCQDVFCGTCQEKHSGHTRTFRIKDIFQDILGGMQHGIDMHYRAKYEIDNKMKERKEYKESLVQQARMNLKQISAVKRYAKAQVRLQASKMINQCDRICDALCTEIQRWRLLLCKTAIKALKGLKLIKTIHNLAFNEEYIALASHMMIYLLGYIKQISPAWRHLSAIECRQLDEVEVNYTVKIAKSALRSNIKFMSCPVESLVAHSNMIIGVNHSQGGAKRSQVNVLGHEFSKTFQWKHELQKQCPRAHRISLCTCKHEQYLAVVERNQYSRKLGGPWLRCPYMEEGLSSVQLIKPGFPNHVVWKGVHQSPLAVAGIKCRDGLAYTTGFSKRTDASIVYKGKKIFTSINLPKNDLFWPHYASTNCSGQVIVTDNKGHKILTVSQYGDFIREIAPHWRGMQHVPQEPHGVCVDEMDRIYVAYKCRNHILRFDRAGNYERVLFNHDDGVYRPICLDYCHKNLFVGCEDGCLRIFSVD